MVGMRRMVWVLVTVAVSYLAISAFLNARPRRTAAEDLQTHAPPVFEILTPAERITAVRFDLQRVTVRVADYNHGRPHAGALAEQACPDHGAAINAVFFAEDWTPLGLILVDGTRISRRMQNSGWPGKWGYFVMRKGRPSILVDTVPPPKGTELLLQCGPRLVIDGAIPKFKDRPTARRSAVGIDAQGRLLFAVADRAITFEQWAATLHDDLGCIDALNLDGGPSTQLSVHGPTDVAVAGGWKVPVFLTAEAK